MFAADKNETSSTSGETFQQLVIIIKMY